MTLFEKVFEKEMALISDESLKQVVLAIGDEVPIYNLLGPSSSSGKYHPVRDRGLSGNVYHTKSVIFVILRMAQSLPVYDDPEERDIIIVAALLHDLYKYNKGDFHTTFLHPKSMYELIQTKIKGVASSGILDSKLERISNMIYKHMSRWNTNEKYNPGISLPIPATFEERLLSLADMIASSSDISINLDAPYP
jgi:hypothetical protein